MRSLHPAERDDVLVAEPKPMVADVLEHAALIIEEFGWQRTEWGNKTKGFCVMGAIVEAGGGTRFNEHALFMDPAYTSALTPVIHDHPGRWNDRSAHTAHEVTAALREAARRVREARP